MSNQVTAQVVCHYTKCYKLIAYLPSIDTHEKNPKNGRGNFPEPKLKGAPLKAPSRQIKQHPPSSLSPESSVRLSLPNQLPPFTFEKPILKPAPAPGPKSASPESTVTHQLGKEVDDDTGDDDDDDDDKDDGKDDDGDDKDDKDKAGDDDDDDDTDGNEDEDDDEEDEDDDDDDDEDDEDEDDDDDNDDDDEDDDGDDDDEEDEDTADEYITEGEEGDIYFGVATTNPIITSYLEGYGLAAGHAEDEIQGLGLIGVFEPYKVSGASSKSNEHFIFTILIAIVLCWLLFTRRA
jgi:hypothetical protein